MAFTRYASAAAADAYTTGDFSSLSNTTQASSANDTTKYIPTLYAGKLLVKFYETSILGDIANTDYEGEIRNQGDAVIIRKLPTISINTHEKGLKLTHANPTVDSVTLEINKGKYWAFVTDDVDDIQTDIKNWISEWTQDAAYELRNAVEQDVIQNIAGSATTTKGSSGSPLYAAAATVDLVDHMIDCASDLDALNVPDDSRFFLLPPSLVGIIKKGDMGDANKSGDSVSIKRNGQVGMIDRFTIYRTNNLTKVTNGGGGANTVFTCLFGHKAATTFATQLLKNEMIPNPDGFGMLHRGLQVYGYKVVKPEALGASFISSDAEAAS